MKYLCGRCIHIDACLVPRSTGCVEECKYFKEMPSHLPKQTNEEYLKSCNTEQLAEAILEMCEYKPCFACGIGHCDDESWCHVYSDEAREFVLEWLKQPHTIKE